MSNARTLVGLIGRPVTHSISPRFQQAAFDALDMPWSYEAWDTAPEQLGATIGSLRSGARRGANITVPYKEAVPPLLDAIADTAARVGAVNTITREGFTLTGHNTDVQGFLDALTLDGGFHPGGCSAVLLGAGGAARAVAVALLSAGASRVMVLNRTPRRADALVAALGGDSRLTTLDGPEASSAAGGADLIVNCTTLGLAGSAGAAESFLREEQIPSRAFVYDIVANPLETPLLNLARRRGCPTLGGLPMLVRQGAAAFTLWTGRPAPLAVMMAAARDAMTAATG